MRGCKMNELQVKMARLHNEILDGNMLPDKVTVDELNTTYKEVTMMIVKRLGGRDANFFATQYLIGDKPALKPKVIEAEVIPPTEVTLTDDMFDAVEDSVRVVGVNKSGELLSPKGKMKYKDSGH